MNYKTTLTLAAIAAAAFVAIGSVAPVFESAFAQGSDNGQLDRPDNNIVGNGNGGNGNGRDNGDNNVVGNCNQADNSGSDSCRNNQGGQAGGSGNTQTNDAGDFS